MVVTDFLKAGGHPKRCPDCGDLVLASPRVGALPCSCPAVVEVAGGDRPAAAGRAFPYPFANDWRKGCWVARPTGKADRDYVYGREFLTGSPHRGSGMVRYSLDDLGGPGWIVACDKRGVRSLIDVRDLEWLDFGEVSAFDVLRVVRAGSWDGVRCPACGVGVVLDDDGGLCANRRCVSDRGSSAASEAARDSQPDAEPF